MSEVKIRREKFGQLNDERTAYLYTLANENGMKVKITNYGGIIVSLYFPDRNGNLEDIVLGYKNLADYFNDSNYFGALIGRYGNRIAQGKFELDGELYQLEINEKPAGFPCCLHGGKNGFNSQLWTVKEAVLDGEKGIKLTHLSEAGEAGFPGNLKAVVYYTLTNDNKLRVEYRAETDHPTIVNLTQHSYFNLRGHGTGSVEDHLLYINGNKYTPVGRDLIPTGEIKEVNNSVFDFTTLKEIGKDINQNIEQFQFTRGYDHNWILNKKEKEMSLASRVIESVSGRQMEVWTTEPGLQFYSGNGITVNGSIKENKKYFERGGLCLETQHYPDSPNQDKFPSTVLRPGEKYRSVTEFRFNLI